jgi:hypothetical protein
MLTERITQRWRRTTIARRFAGLLGCVAVSMAMKAGAPEEDPPGPAAADVVHAWSVGRRWLDAFSTPDPLEASSSVPLGGAAAACVILRREGRVVGMGVADGEAALMVRRAAGRAMSQLLVDPAIARLPPEVQAEVGRSMTLELEVAGAPEPLLGRTFEQAAAPVEPGVDGVAMRRGEQWEWLFPSQMLIFNTAGDAAHQLPMLAQRLGLTPRPLEELVRGHGVSVYRFRTIHLAQAEARSPPFQAMRGDVPVGSGDVKREALRRLADDLALHMLGRLWPDPPRNEATGIDPPREPLGMMGDYRAAADDYRPLIATPLEQALSSLALSEYAASPGVDATIAARAHEAARTILGDLQRTIEGEDDPLASTASAGAIVLAMLAQPATLEDPVLAPLYDGALREVMRAAGDPPREGDTNDPLERARRSPHTLALTAAALAAIFRHAPTEVDGALVRSAIDTAWASAEGERRLALVPWIGRAELDHAHAAGTAPAGARSIRELLARLEAARVGGPQRGGAPDLHGGFILPGASTPDAHTARPAAFLAAMLRDPAITPRDSAAVPLGRHLETMRFILQLSVRPESRWSCRNPRRAAGGIRSAPWDADQPAAAQAMGLLAAAETLRSLEALSGRPEER